MASKEKIREIRKVLEKYKKLSYNKFKEKVVEKEKLMAAQTFSDGLKEAVDSGIIRREEGLDGKRKVVHYSIPEIAVLEDEYFDFLSSTITGFQQEFERVDEFFSELSDIEKGQLLLALLDWYYAMQAKIALGHSRFNSQKFADMSKFLAQYMQDFDELIFSGDEKQQSSIWDEIFLGWGDVEDYNIKVIDDLLGAAEARAHR